MQFWPFLRRRRRALTPPIPVPHMAPPKRTSLPAEVWLAERTRNPDNSAMSALAAYDALRQIRSVSAEDWRRCADALAQVLRPF
jgi:hypothetical protein